MLRANLVNNIPAKTYVLSMFLLLMFVFSYGQDQNISNGTIFEGEPYIAVDPVNTQHLVVAWMGYFPFTKTSIKTKVSFDGGQTWSSLNYIPHTNTAYGSADPSLAFDNSGNVFLSFIDFDKDTQEGAVFIVKSTDGGLTWENPTEVINANTDTQKPVDRPWISIDNSGGTYDGTIYVTSMPPKVFGYLPPPYHPYFIKSTNGGQSFETWRYLDTVNWLAGNVIPQPMPTNCVSSDGTFYAVYPSYVYSQNPLAQFIIASSEDAGNSFAYHSVFSSAEGITDTLVKAGYLIRSDPSDPQHLAFFYLSVTYGDIDVYMRESYDKGVTWSKEIRLNDDPVENNKIQDLLWADFDTDGDLIVTWRDRRNGTDTTYTTASEIWGTLRKNGQSDFSDNFTISDTLVPYDTILAFAGNDFMCSKLINDTLNAVWGDTRNGKLNIWFKQFAVDGTLLNIKKISSEDIPKNKIYPNPFTSVINIKIRDVKKIIIYNQKEKQVFATQNQSKKINLDFLPSGIYFIKVISNSEIYQQKIIKLK